MPLAHLKLSWNLRMTPKELLDRAKKLISNQKNEYDQLIEVTKEKCSYNTFLKPLTELERKFQLEAFQYDLIRFVSTDKDLRHASSQAKKMTSQFILETDMREDLFDKLLVLESKRLDLSSEANYYLTKKITTMKRYGLHLPKVTQNEIRDLQLKIDDLVLQFTENISDDQTYLEFTESELDGLPEDFINNLSLSPDSQKRKVTMKYPDYMPVIKLGKNSETRKKLHIAFNSRIKKNATLLEEILALRHKFANLLGYPTFSDYRSAVLMVKSAKNIDNFLKDLAHKMTPGWKEEKKYLLELKEKECKLLNLPFDGKLNAWDLAYFIRIGEKEKFSLDVEKLKEYFPLPVVIQGLFKIYQLLLSVSFQELENSDVWDPDVKTFGVTDTKSGKFLGYFFFDLFPRDGKYTHYRVGEMQHSCLQPDGIRQVGAVTIIGNFPKHSAEKPSLLSHHEVKTLFHEFGHVMHFLCNRAEYSIFGGTDVDMDFLEAPSQMLENWCWFPESLKLMSAHYIDQSPIPENMLNGLIKSELAYNSYHYLNQIYYSLIDQKLHTEEKPNILDIIKTLRLEILGLEIAEATNHCTHFLHLARHYGACYYCYLWSEVFSVDMFDTCFGQSNLLNSEVGRKYKEKILAPGGTKDPMDLLKAFLGREPNQEAFLRRKGFLQA